MGERDENEERWSVAKRLAFPFVASYLLIYCFELVGSFVGLKWLENHLVLWTARNMLGIRHDFYMGPNGSGDTTHQYVLVLVHVLVAVAAGIIWNIAGYRRSEYNKAFHLVRVVARYYLAFYLLVYGGSKFFHGQFPEPGIRRLIQPYGESSPMGLAWTFFGYSTGYGVFMGFFECIGGVLMLFRGTTLLGALIAAAVVANIVAVNFCFDVPVKLFSSHLFLLCLFIMAPDAHRLFRFFVSGKTVPARNDGWVIKGDGWRVARVIVKVLVIVYMAVVLIATSSSGFSRRSRRVVSPMQGSYKVTEFVRNGLAIPAVDTDWRRWEKLIVDGEDFALLETASGLKRFMYLKVDTVAKTWVIEPQKHDFRPSTLHYSIADSVLFLKGTYIFDSVEMRLEYEDPDRLLLRNRGFHWINEYPFNR